MPLRSHIIRMLLVAAVSCANPLLADDEPISFNRDIRPILASKCLACHGPDDHGRQADLRLDTFEGATTLHDGHRAIDPGKLESSEVVRRITSTDPDVVMPPPDAKKTLTLRQTQLLQQWIRSGAAYDRHWAFDPPKSPPIPELSGIAIPAGWGENPIDRFVLAKMLAEKFLPSPSADRHTLIRRVSLDLIGLPPTPAEADAFAADPDPLAYEKLVDRLLASEHYGERWARKWLDLARYADTNGYEKDRERPIWPYRDWVIRALNADMPFDQFTIEQLAGDMLPNATRDQLVATGFHRNTMLNEEGGIDPLEFRHYAMTDRVATTSTTWLGLTMACVQCHTHKYDPIQHAEYYRMMALLNNADEPDFDLTAPETSLDRENRLARVAKMLDESFDHWPIDKAAEWITPTPKLVTTESGQVPIQKEDGSLLFPANGPDNDVYTILLETTSPQQFDRLRLETLIDESLPNQGPGRVTHGNFVLSEITVRIEPLLKAEGEAVNVRLVSATASAQQDGYPITAAFDGNERTGWAVHASGKNLNTNKEATFQFERPIGFPGGSRWIVVMTQKTAAKHTIGRPRLSFGYSSDGKRRQDAAEGAYSDWLGRVRSSAVIWRELIPTQMKANLAFLEVQSDHSIYASGDTSKDDTYELSIDSLPAGVSALRLEALPDDRLPARGPGMAYYEGPKGDFYVAELDVVSGDKKLAIKSASADVGKAQDAVDGHMQTGWNVGDRIGEAHQAVFVFSEPIFGGKPLTITLRMGRHYAASLGRFRLSITTDPRGGVATTVPHEMESLLLVPDSELTAAQRRELRNSFIMQAAELGSRAKEIRALLNPPAGQNTLVMRERPAENPRPTRRHHRGEFLQPREVVTPGVPAVILRSGQVAPSTRLEFARWLVSSENPLTARVVVNRQWASLFGQGIVRTAGDFGVMGDTPTHPELLDYLATEFIRDRWSLKRLHRRIVTSTTYRQSSRVTAESSRLDPQNRLLSHAPRTRVDAEIVRDIALSASGLLSLKMFGPPVRPPQSSSAGEAAYGGGNWSVSSGGDRYRRGLYTFIKRTFPYAMFNTFDGPSGEVCVAQREASNTPLQSLTLLNDVVFIEAAQQLGRVASAADGDDSTKAALVFRACLTRKPTPGELERLRAFIDGQRTQLLSCDEAALTKIAGSAIDVKTSMLDRAVWTMVSRALLNLDETITRN